MKIEGFVFSRALTEKISNMATMSDGYNSRQLGHFRIIFEVSYVLFMRDGAGNLITRHGPGRPGHVGQRYVCRPPGQRFPAATPTPTTRPVKFQTPILWPYPPISSAWECT